MKFIGLWVMVGTTVLILGAVAAMHYKIIGLVAVCMFGGIGCL
jgi:hypothetical protein